VNNESEKEASQGRKNQRQESESGLGARAQQAAEQLKEAAHERADRVRHGADNAREQAARRVRKLGVAVRAIGETMRVDDEQYIAQYAQKASERLDGIARYLNDTETQDVIHDAEQFVLRRPGVFVGGALLVGLVAGRFLKSSAPRPDVSAAPQDTAFASESRGNVSAPEPAVPLEPARSAVAPRTSPTERASAGKRDVQEPRNGAST
jgi:ElaB/YqjD/DUF883 family membrane-anchored ribosome-binding protein